MAVRHLWLATTVPSAREVEVRSQRPLRSAGTMLSSASGQCLEAAESPFLLESGCKRLAMANRGL